MRWIKLGLFSFVLVAHSFLGDIAVHADSQNVVISQIIAGDASAVQEFISIYNNGASEVDITGWCLKSESLQPLACITAPSNTRILVSIHGYAKIASTDFAASHPIINPNDRYDATYSVTNHSSGNIIGSHDTISLVDGANIVQDSVSWSTALSSGNMLQRQNQNGVMTDTGTIADFTKLTTWTQLPMSGTFEESVAPSVCPEGYLFNQEGVCQPDSCQNIDGLQLGIPDGYDSDAVGNCTLHDECDNLPDSQPIIPEGFIRKNAHDCGLDLVPLQLTEILPNASGSDTGHEFIEIYNPSNTPVDLSSYVIRTGVAADKSYSFPSGARIGPGEYEAFYDNAMKFTLVNTTGRVVLAGTDGTILDDTGPYESPNDDIAWSMVDGVWQYTNQPTPGKPNLPSFVEEGSTVASTVSTTGCPAGKYRNPLTNRCRNIESDAVVLASCESDQYRNPETGRCRKIATASLALPCKISQYRSEETGRCRNIVTAAAPAPCKEGQERNQDTNRCRNVSAKSVPDAAFAVQKVKDGAKAFIGWWALGGVGSVALGYAGWEWRREASALMKKVLSVKLSK